MNVIHIYSRARELSPFLVKYYRRGNMVYNNQMHSFQLPFQRFFLEMFIAKAVRTDISFQIGPTYLRFQQRSFSKMVSSPPCRIPRPQTLYTAQRCDWWSSEWHKGGGQPSGPPGWRWLPSENTHTVVHKPLNKFTYSTKQWGGTSTSGYILTKGESLLSSLYYFITFHVTDT